MATLTRLVIQKIDVWPAILLLNFFSGHGRCNTPPREMAMAWFNISRLSWSVNPPPR